MKIFHQPVMLEEVLFYLKINPVGIYVDATCGEGGHLINIAKLLSPKGMIIGIDADAEILKKTKERIKEVKTKIILQQGNYKNLGEYLHKLNIKNVNGILYDLGFSAYHLNCNRGFSFKENSPLDMRFDTNNKITASFIVNNYSRDKLIKLFYEKGEETKAKIIADKICEARKKEKINTTVQLENIVYKAYRGKRKKIHPATKVFQALRIEVNDELKNIEFGIKEGINYLAVGGRICVITYHSLEDRIIKNLFKDSTRSLAYPPLSRNGFITPTLKILSPKPLAPSKKEIRENPRAHSAKLRVAEKINKFIN